jgi:alkylresorcinol/alkylpyrone synthase
MLSSASVASVTVEFPPHQVGQQEALSGLTGFGGPKFDRFGASAGVETRRLAIPLARYGKLNGFTEANDIFIDTALGAPSRCGRCTDRSLRGLAGRCWHWWR